MVPPQTIREEVVCLMHTHTHTHTHTPPQHLPDNIGVLEGLQLPQYRHLPDG